MVLPIDSAKVCINFVSILWKLWCPNKNYKTLITLFIRSSWSESSIITTMTALLDTLPQKNKQTCSRFGIRVARTQLSARIISINTEGMTFCSLTPNHLLKGGDIYCQVWPVDNLLLLHKKQYRTLLTAVHQPAKSRVLTRQFTRC